MDENLSTEERIIKAAEALGIPVPDREQLDYISTYHMEQQECADDLYRSAVEDGIPFATMDNDGDVYVNVNWLGMIVGTVAQGGPLPESTLRLAEVLNQTIMASKKFVGKV